MPQIDEHPPVETTAPAPLRVRVRPKPATDTKPKTQPPHAVILHNDPVNGFDWVVAQLRKVLRCSGPRAYWLTLKVHLGGRGIVWTGSLEVAELKAEQLKSCGCDPRKIGRAPTLSVSVEPLPG